MTKNNKSITNSKHMYFDAFLSLFVITFLQCLTLKTENITK